MAAFRLRELGIVVALVVAIAFFAFRATNFLTAGNWQNIALDVAMVVVVAVGQTMVVLTRNIDLSVGSIVGLTAFISRRHARRAPGTPDRRRSRCAVARRPRLRARQRAPRHRRQGARDHRDARHAAIYRGLVFEVSGGAQVSPFQLPSSFLDFAFDEAARRCRRSP